MAILTDNPALNAWIIVGLIVATLVGLGATRFLGLKAYNTLSGFGVPQMGMKLIFYIPVALLSFGVIADIISQSFKFSLGSLVGAVAMALNGLIGIVLTRSVSAESPVSAVAATVAAAPAAVAAAVTSAVNPNDVGEAASRAAKATENAAEAAWEAIGQSIPSSTNPVRTSPFTGGANEFCSFPGLENFDNKYAPQNILVVTTIMFYYMIGEWESGNASRTVAPGVTLLLTVLAQIGTMYASGCLNPWWSPVGAIVGGSVFGISGYHIVKALNGSATPFIANQTTKTAGGLGDVEAPPIDAAKPADGSKCAQANDDDQFVCDLYKNGELVTTTVSG